MNILTMMWGWLGENYTEVIAFCALLLTIYQAYLHRKHNKLSVKPMLDSSASRYRYENNNAFKVEIVNKGLGPAVIKKYNYEIDGVPRVFSSSVEANDVLLEMLDIPVVSSSITTLLPNQIITPGERVLITELIFKNNDEDTWIAMEQLIDRLSLRIEYESIYEKKYSYHSIDSHS